MEFCPHCRGLRRERKTTRERDEVRDGQTVRLRVHTYHCAQCGSFLFNNEQVMGSGEAEPAEAAAPAEASPVVPSPDDAPAV
jgi:hypothetical protein